MKTSRLHFLFATVFMSLASLAGLASPASAAPTLVQTIDLAASTVVPVVSPAVTPLPLPQAFIVFPTYVPAPQPAPGSAFSLTSIAVDPVINTIYVADHASSNVYLIDGATNTVTSAIYTYGFFGNIDGAPPGMSGLSGKVVTTVLANPVTNTWLLMGEDSGAQFSGTTFVERVAAQAMQSGGAWDPVTGNVYGATGGTAYASTNLRFLLQTNAGSCNAFAVNPMTSRAYASCFLGLIGATATNIATVPNYGIQAYDGVVVSQGLTKFAGTPVLAVPLQNANAQPTGLALNPNTNRIYAAAALSPTTLDVLDASTYQVLASIPGLPDQSADQLVVGVYGLPLPRPIAINTVTNTIFVVNSVGSTVSVFDGNTNTLTGTLVIPVPDGAIVNVAVPPDTLIQEIKTGNTLYDKAIVMPGSVATLTSLGGAVALAVNESTNTLYVASVNGTISVFALDAATAPAAFSVNGVIDDAQGVPAVGVTVNAAGPGGAASAVTDATGLFVLTGLPAGTYTVKPASAAFSFAPASQSTAVNGANVRGLAFTANPPLPPLAPSSYTLGPWTTIGAGMVTTATVTLSQPAPAGGAVLTLSASDPKAAKIPSTVTVPAGQSSVPFPVQGSGVSITTLVTLTAAYNGAAANAIVTVAPGDKLSVTAATYSLSTHVLTVSASDSDAQATLNVYLGSNNQLLGTMLNQGGTNNFTFQQPYPAGTPASVNVVSNLGGKKIGQSVKLTP